MRSEILNKVLEIADLEKVIDGTKELRAPQMAKDKSDVEKVKKMIKETLIPFDESINKGVFFIIRTGRKLDEDYEMFLVAIISE